jgi:hypothetical protein
MRWVLSVFPIYLGFSYFESGLSRKRGKAIELQSKKELAAVLPEDWVTRSDRDEIPCFFFE